MLVLCRDTLLLNEGQVLKSVSVSRQPQGDELEVHLVHMDYGEGGEGRGGEGREERGGEGGL